MEQVEYKVINMKGKEVEKLSLDPEVFAAPANESLVHEVVRWQRARRRAGTHSTLNRAKMEGGGRKPWRQKGTGRARSGSRNSPLWVGGAVAHGPAPRSYDFRLSKRSRRQALAVVLSDKVKNNNLVILDKLEVASGKTKDMLSVFKDLGLEDQNAVIVMPEKDACVWRSSSNLKKVTALPVAGANVYDLLNHRCLLSTKEGVLALQNRVKRAASTETEK